MTLIDISFNFNKLKLVLKNRDMLFIIAFLLLGFLIGNLTGLTVDSAISSLITLLFAFGGGSAIAFVHKLKDIERKLASKAIIALSLGCLLGIYLSVLISERQLLTPEAYRTSPDISTIDERKVLRSDYQTQASIIDQLYKDKNNSIDAEKAYEMLYEYVMKTESNEK